MCKLDERTKKRVGPAEYPPADTMTQETKTQHNWVARRRRDGEQQYEIYEVDGLIGPIAELCFTNGNDDEVARLIAAAPQLLEALEQMLAAFPAPKIRAANGFDGNLAHAAARSAIQAAS